MRVSHLKGLRLRVVGAVVALLAGLLAAVVGTAGTAQAASSLPCDVYAAAGTPCVAAHSTTRALLASYSFAVLKFLVL